MSDGNPYRGLFGQGAENPYTRLFGQQSEEAEEERRRRARATIDLERRRPLVHNADGSVSTVRTISIGTDEGEVLIPTVTPEGRLLSEQEAVARYRQTGQHLGIFDSPESATAAAERLHQDEEQKLEAARRRLAGIRARGDIGAEDVSDPEVAGLRSLLYGPGATEKGVARDKAAIADLGFGWAVGGAEKLGLVPEGTRAELRAAHEDAQDAYLTAHPEGGLGRATAEALRTSAAGMVGPQAALGPGLGALAAGGSRLLGAGPALARVAGALGGAAEGAGQGLLDTIDLTGEERRNQVLLGTALGTLGGAAASRGGRAPSTPSEAPLAGPRRAVAEAIAPELRAERRALERAADVDHLTGLANRRALDKALPAAEADPGTAVLVFDANNFGQVNKKVGQEAGDRLLEEVAGAVRKAAEENGVGGRVFRRGGDELVVLAPVDAADAVRARAEELFGSHVFRAGEPDQFTVSLTGTAGRTFGEADSTLQAAKAARKAREAPLDPGEPAALPARPEPPPSPAEPEQAITSTANAVTAAEREARGLPEVEVEARRTLGDSWELAQQRLVEDPLAGHKLASDLAKRPRAASAEENALLLRDRMRLQNEHRAALAAETAAGDAGDQAAMAAARVRRAAAEEALDINDRAARRAGYEWGLAGRARQMAIREDYSFSTLFQRAKNAVRASPRLTADQVEARLQPVREHLATMADRLVEAEENLRLYQEAAQERRAARVLKREAVVAKRLAGKGGREVAAGDLVSEFEVLRADFRAKAATPRAGLDPDLASVVYRMARNRVRAGVNSLEQVVADVHAAVKDAADLGPADIRDAIADGGAPKAARQIAPDAKRMVQLREEARLVRILEAAEQGRPIPTRGGKPRTLPPPELAALREQVREVLERHGIGPGSEPARLAALKRRLRAAAERERATIATGERPAPRARRPPPEFDEEAIRLQAEVVRLRHEADTTIRNLELQNRTGLEKAIDWTVGWGRALKLTSVATATKLVSSGIARTFIFNPLRHVAGAPLAKLPGEYGRFVRERAPIEGGFSGQALVKSWARFFSKDTRAAIWGHLARMEEDPLTLAHGGHSYLADSVKALDTVPKPMQYIAHLLAAYEDTPVKYAAYQYAISKMEKFQQAMEAQGAEILARGGDLTAPLEQLNAQAHAFEYATRQVFMQNDRVVSAFRRLVDRKPGDAAEKQLLKGLIETQLPILKVPVNMAKERLEYFGPVSLAHGLLRLRRAVKAGVDTIPYDVGDSIVREIKHGSIGTAAALLGWYGYEHFGGYRTPLRPKSDEPHEGEIEVFGVTIPRGLADHPLLMQMQFFATMRKMAERYGKGEFFSEGTGRGVAAAAIGTAKSVPFYDVPFESGKSLENSVTGRGRGVQGFVGAYERGMILPPDVQRRARIQDQRDEPSAGEQALQQLGLQRVEPRRRTPDDLWEEFLMGVPGARNTVR